MDDVDYGPLNALIGEWRSDQGMDVSPAYPSGADQSPYQETLLFEPAGQVENAEEQLLSVLRYHQVVMRNSNGKVFHNETGYWMWDPASDLVMQSLTIPRGVCLIAGGKASTTSDGITTIAVHAALEDTEWQIVQSPFMQKKARTLSFDHTVTRDGDRLLYHETTWLEIYGRRFEHTDKNTLVQA